MKWVDLATRDNISNPGKRPQYYSLDDAWGKCQYRDEEYARKG